MPPDQTIRDRIKLGCIHMKVKQQDLAGKIGVSKQEISHVGGGRYRSGRVIESVAKVLGVSVEWLLTGKGNAPSWAQQVGAAEAEPDQSQEERLRRAESVIDLLVKNLEAKTQGLERAEMALGQAQIEVAELRQRLEVAEKRLAKAEGR